MQLAVVQNVAEKGGTITFDSERIEFGPAGTIESFRCVPFDAVPWLVRNAGEHGLKLEEVRTSDLVVLTKEQVAKLQAPKRGPGRPRKTPPSDEG